MLNAVDVARETYVDPEVQTSGVIQGSRKIKLCYFVLLYNNKLYDELAEMATSYNQVTVDEWTLFMAVLYRIGTKEAFAQAMELDQGLGS